MRSASILLIAILVSSHNSACAQEPPRLDLALQTGHSSAVTSVALSGDGQYVVTASSDKTAILWDAASGKPVQTFQGHVNYITSVAVSGDGKTVVTSADDSENGLGSAILWDAVSGKQLHSFRSGTQKRKPRLGPEHNDALFRSGIGRIGVALSRDGKRVLTGSVDQKRAILWDAASGKQLQSFEGHPLGLLACVALSGDGKDVVTGSYDKTAIVWDAASGKQLRTLHGHTDGVNSVSMSGDGKLVLTAAMDTGSGSLTVILWEAVSGKKLSTFQRPWPGSWGTSVALSFDGNCIAVNGPQETILWELDRDKKAFPWDNDVTKTGMALSSDGKRFVTGHGKSAILWDVASGKILQTFERQHPTPVGCMALSGDGKYVATGTTDGPGQVILWDTNPGMKGGGKEPRTFQLLFGTVHLFGSANVALNDDGKFLAAGSSQRGAILWNTNPDMQGDSKKLQEFDGHNKQEGWLWGVALSGNGKRLVTASVDKTAILWDTASGKQLQSFEGHTHYVTSAALSLDADLVVTGSYDKTAILWDAVSGKQLRALKEHTAEIMSVALSDKHVLTGSCDMTAILWDAASGKRLRTFEGHGGPVTRVALTPFSSRPGRGERGQEDKHVVTGSSDHTAVLWDTASGKKRQTFRGHTSSITGVALDGDGKHLWTASFDGTIRLWDLATGKERIRLCTFPTSQQGAGKDWLVVTSEGFFDGSANVWRFVSYRVPGTVKLVDDDATRRRFHRPGLLAQIRQGK